MFLQPSIPDSKTNHTPTSALPVILCLHGGGTNSTIFTIQTIRLQRALASHFDFVYLDAPFVAPPGPGVLPFFEGCGPFYRWGNHGSPDLSEETKQKLLLRIQEVEEGTGEFASKGAREVVSVLGFSQGGRCAAGLVLEQQLNVAGPLRKFKGFRFGVFMNSTSPPLVSVEMDVEDRKTLVTLPAVHVIGSEDPWRDEGERLYREHFDESTACLIELPIGHRLPVEEKDTQSIVKEILRVWKQVRDGSRAAV